MSKYIRTKERIINISKHKIVKRMYDGVYFKNSYNEVWRVIYTEDIKAEADTIDELCDEFVLKATINGQTEYQHDKRLTILKNSKIAYESLGYSCEIHGAIWKTGRKGEPILESVAQMNEKGDLELL